MNEKDFVMMKPKITTKKRVSLYEWCMERKPILIQEWHPTKNKLRPNSFSCGSGKRVWWLCSNPNCHHEWETTILNRTKNKSSCPECAKANRYKVKNQNNLLKKGSLLDNYPNVAKDWHSKNAFGPHEVLSHSDKKVWWACSICGNEWNAIIASRTARSTGCPKCSSKRRRENSRLIQTCPEIVKEWHPKNPIAPDYYTKSSTEKVWWKCTQCGSDWKQSIRNRYKGHGGCPECKKA